MLPRIAGVRSRIWGAREECSLSACRAGVQTGAVCRDEDREQRSVPPLSLTRQHAQPNCRPTDEAQRRGRASVSCPAVPHVSGSGPRKLIWLLPHPQHSVKVHGVLVGTGWASLTHLLQAQGVYQGPHVSGMLHITPLLHQRRNYPYRKIERCHWLVPTQLTHCLELQHRSRTARQCRLEKSLYQWEMNGENSSCAKHVSGGEEGSIAEVPAHAGAPRWLRAPTRPCPHKAVPSPGPTSPGGEHEVTSVLVLSALRGSVHFSLIAIPHPHGIS